MSRYAVAAAVMAALAPLVGNAAAGVFAGGAAFAVAAPLTAQQTPPPAVEGAAVRVATSPERPVQGTLFVVAVETDGARPVELMGRFAGEALHFELPDSGAASGTAAWAVAAVPVDAPASVALELDLRWADGRRERKEVAVAIAPGRYAMEKLTVAPQFGRPLSAELQRRTADESERAMAVARGAHGTPRMWAPGAFARPRPGRVTSGFGSGREFNGQVQSRHLGTDLNGAVGEPVLAPADGVVRLVDAFYLGGNVIYVDHGGGLSTGYLHLSRALVAAGDTVRAGQHIGNVGATGRVTGPHLHWIVRYGDVTIDPLSVVGLKAP